MNQILMVWADSHRLIVWLFIALIFLMFEIGSPGLFFFLSFFFGALLAAVSTFITGLWLIQVLLFLIGSLVAFFSLTRWVKKRSSSDQSHTLTNVYAMRSKRGIVVKKITEDTMGQVKVGGEVWLACSHHNISVEKGAKVVVVRIKGAHLVVEEDIEQ